MNDFILKQFHYSYWATAELIKNIEANGISDEYLFKMLSHNLNAQFMRLAMLKGETTTFTVWDVHTLEQLKIYNEQSFEIAQNFIKNANQAEFDRLVTSKTLSGDVFTIAVSDILMHLINHGSHHRGQIATKLRELGFLPPNFGILQFNIMLNSNL